MKQFVLVLTFTIIASIATKAQQTSVLFLGNSYTYTADLPGTLNNLATEAGDDLYFESNTPPGYTFEGHSTNGTTLNKIASRDWDFVVLQEQSQRPSFGAAQVANQVYSYAEILVDSIRSNYECTEPLFFMTWGRRDGDQDNCANIPALCTYEGMQGRLRNAYLEMTSNNDATVAPCGAAWQQMALNNDQFFNGLYINDGSHPSAWGTYLNACVFYATIFRKSPVGIPYYSNIGQADAEVLQQLAEDVVLDSLSTWNIGHADVVADATHSPAQTGQTWQFDNASINATSHFWDFGENNDTSTEQNPVYTFVNPNPEVMYIASSNCDADTLYLYPGFSSVDDSEVFKNVIVFQDGSAVSISNKSNQQFEIQILDVSGRLTAKSSINPKSQIYLDNELNTGLNLIRIFSEKYSRTYKIVTN